MTEVQCCSVGMLLVPTSSFQRVHCHLGVSKWPGSTAFLHHCVSMWTAIQISSWPLWEIVVSVKILLRCPENSQSAMEWILIFRNKESRQSEMGIFLFVLFYFCCLLKKRKNMKDCGINLTSCAFASMAWFLTSHSRWRAPCHTGARAQFPRLQVHLVVDRN